MGDAVEKRGVHLGVAKDSGPLAQGEVGGDHDRSVLVEPADQVEEQLPARLGEGQIAKFVEDDEVRSGEMVGRVSLSQPSASVHRSALCLGDLVRSPSGLATSPETGGCGIVAARPTRRRNLARFWQERGCVGVGSG